MSLRAYKKSELKEMCSRLNLSDEGYKGDLEDRLQAFLDERGLALEDTPELADHFIDLPVSPSTARKAARKSLALLTEDESDLDAKLGNVKQQLSHKMEQAAHEVEVSPSKVAAWAYETRKQVFANGKLPQVVRKTIPKAASNARGSLSKVSTVAAISVIVEGAMMTKALVPLSYEVRFGGLRSITLPDIFVFLSVKDYWKPILTWLSFQLIPLFISAAFNFRADNASRRDRKSHAAQHAYDPFTFALSKLLMLYLAFFTSVGSKFPQMDLTLVHYIVGNETFIIGTAVTLVYAIYEAIL